MGTGWSFERDFLGVGGRHEIIGDWVGTGYQNSGIGKRKLHMENSESIYSGGDIWHTCIKGVCLLLTCIY